MPRGILYLIVGPSGAGKDTLIAEACRHREDLFLMPRTMTRPAEAGNDKHIAVTSEEFAALKRNYQFSLSWDAHGLRYGIARDLEQRLADGQSILLNGSRSIVNEVREKFQPVKVINVTASFDILSRRLRARGREDAEAIENRLGRANRSQPQGDDVVTIDNSGSLEDGIEAFLAALT